MNYGQSMYVDSRLWTGKTLLLNYPDVFHKSQRVSRSNMQQWNQLGSWYHSSWLKEYEVVHGVIKGLMVLVPVGRGKEMFISYSTQILQ